MVTIMSPTTMESHQQNHSNQTTVQKVPFSHLAIIPDGNRRWAKENNIPVLQVHDTATDRLVPLVEKLFKDTDIETLTLWGLSSENLSRPSGEVNAIYDVIFKFVPKLLPILHKYQIKFDRIGSVVGLPEDVLEILTGATQETSCYNSRKVNVALNYGGRKDIVEAVNQIITENPSKTEISTHDIDTYVSMGSDKYPEPELIIRTGTDSNCVRSSGFVTWQGMNSYYYFVEDFLPDITWDVMFQAFIEYEKFINNK